MLQENLLTFRAACHYSVVGIVIGRRAMKVRSLERQTLCKIEFERHDSGSALQVFKITGDRVPNQLIDLNGDERHVSTAQTGMLKVLEAIFQVEVDKGLDASVRTFCLLVHQADVGSIIGEGRQTIDQIREYSGSTVVLKEPPPSARIHEILIEITGDELAVRRGFICISAILLNREPAEKVYAEYFPDAFNMVLSGKRIKVEFSFLVPHYTVGLIIGKRGSSVRVLEREAGAFIEVNPCQTEHQQHVVTVFSYEGIRFSHSPAQNAVFLVFAKYSGAKAGPATFKLILKEEEATYLKGALSEITEKTGCSIKILGDGIKPNWVQGSVVEVTGEYQTVENVILQLTTSLRKQQISSLPVPGQIELLGQIERMDNATIELDGIRPATLDLVREISGVDINDLQSETALRIQTAQRILQLFEKEIFQ